MKYSNVNIEAFGYELAPNVVTTEDLEARLNPVYKKLHLKPGQLEALTGIIERRYWDQDFAMHEGATRAGKKAIASSNIPLDQIGMLIYAGVCRDNLEPATACATANALGIGSGALVYDVSNACLGVLNGMVQAASAIELGHVKAALIVSCESARQIVDQTIDRLNRVVDMDTFKKTIATLTGGSGAVAVLLADKSVSANGHKIVGAVVRNATQHHHLCRWGSSTGILAENTQVMETDSIGVLKNGVSLGIDTFKAFMKKLQWQPDKIICHQVGSAHQKTILDSIGIGSEKDFSTFPYLGNIGTVSLPITAAIADERNFLVHGDRVGFFGIGSGLNCIMMGVQW
jgi:acyl-CoA:acyl-CoA alkyltransferase